MPSLRKRISTAVKVLWYGLPRKNLPFAWPDLVADKPQWRLIDVASYIREGFNENTLVYSAVMFKARSMSAAPLRVYRGAKEFPERVEDDHPLVALVERPNEHQSWIEFHSQNVVFLNITGEVFLFRDPKNGYVYSLRPDRVIIRPTGLGVSAGIFGYVYVPEGKSVSEGVPILPEYMYHIKLPNPSDPLEGMGYGMPPLGPGARSTDIDNMVTSFLYLFFKRGAMLTGLLKFKAALNDSICSELLSRWKARYGGYDKWGVGILDRGGEYERIALTFQEMGFEDLDARNETRILGPFGIPPILIGSRVGLERSTYANYGEARKMVWQDTLWPELQLYQAEYERAFAAEGVFTKFDVSQVPAMQLDLPPLVGAAYRLWMMGVPAQQALQVVGVPCGTFPGGDVPRPMDLLSSGGDPVRLDAGEGDEEGDETEPVNPGREDLP